MLVEVFWILSKVCIRDVSHFSVLEDLLTVSAAASTVCWMLLLLLHSTLKWEKLCQKELFYKFSLKKLNSVKNVECLLSRIFSKFLEYCVLLLSNVFFRRTIGLRFHESVLSILLPLSMDDLDDFFLFFSACEETPPLFGGKSAIFNKKNLSHKVK